MAKLQVNGKLYNLDVEPEMPLLWALRNEIGLTGTKYGCGIAQCGACTVLVDGKAARSCTLPVSAAEGKPITTIEGLAVNGRPHPVQEAWVAEDVALLKQKPNPSDEDISTISSICRCGTYVRIRRAIHRAAGKV
jgi:isoquinoline 1-oxidoreductase alpha subunit